MKSSWKSDITKVLFFGGLSYFFGEVQVIIPVVESGQIDLREILLLISVFYFSHWFYLIPVVLITALGVPASPMLWILTTSHIAAIIPVYFLYKYTCAKTSNTYFRGISYFFITLAYYFVFMYPIQSVLTYISDISPGKDLKQLYAELPKKYVFEVVSNAIISPLFLIIHLFRNALQIKNNELLIAKNKAEESDRLKTAFLNNLSHEIRTPLNGIVGFTGLLYNDNYSKEEAHQFKSYIQENTDYLLKLIDKIIDISKFDAGGHSLNYDWLDLFGVTQKINERIREESPYLSKNSIDFTIQIEPMLQQKLIYTDELNLSEIIVNLVNNAIKFTEKGTVELKLRKKGERKLFMHVKDTGIGISKEDKEKVFNRFYRGEFSDTTIRGIGLGLSITKQIVELLKGKIWFESVPDTGSDFFVELPVKYKNKEREISHESNSPEKPSTLNKDVLILVAEDDDINFFYLEETLKRQNIEVVRAKNGYEAVDFVQDNKKISLVLMDIKMPQLDGASATKIIRDFNKDIPIIAQTAYAMVSDKQALLSAGCNDYISKPIDRDKLGVMLKKYLKV